MKNKILIYVSIVLFGIAGIYLTFFVGNISKYDSQIKAYRIENNESYTNDGSMYYPTFYYSVGGKNYECKTSSGSSLVPDENNNIVYYDSADPTKCTTQYEKSNGKIGGIICFVAAGIIIYFFVIRKPTDGPIELKKTNMINTSNIDEEKIISMVGKAQLIYKRVILGIVIAILLFLILLDGLLFIQTIKAKDYIETTATYVDKKIGSEDSILDDYIYTFVDKNGNNQEITISVSKDSTVENEMKVKYNENNPQEFYEENALLNKSGLILYIVKLVLLLLLIFLFFNKKLLSKINISSSINKS